MKRILLTLLAIFVFLFENQASAVVFENGIIEDGIYYLYNESQDAFLSRGDTWGTRATLDKYGVPIRVQKENNFYLFQYIDDIYQRYLGEEELPYVDKTPDFPIHWECINTKGSIFVLKNISAGYLGDNGVNKGCSFRNKISDATEFTFVNAEEYKRIIGGRYSLSVEIRDYEPVDVTDKIQNPSMAYGITGWTSTFWSNTGAMTIRSNLVEVYQQIGDLSQTITGLEPGIYKFTLDGFYRGSSNAYCVDIEKQGFTLCNAYIFANEYQNCFATWASDRISAFYPNTMEEAYELIRNGKYKNELYARVAEDGVLKIGLCLPQWVASSWLIWGNATLTYYAKKDNTDPEQDKILGTALIIQLKNGNTESYYLKDKPEISFYEDNLFIVSDKIKMTSFRRSEIADLHFVGITSAINNTEIAKDEIRFVYLDNNTIEIYGSSFDREDIKVYDLNGYLQFTQNDVQGDCVSISLSSLNRGIYIIKCGNKKSIKINKK